MDNSSTSEPAPAGQPVALDMAALRTQQNFPLAVIAGLGAALGGALLWAVVTVMTQSELGIMAIAVGYLVGNAIKVAGNGVEKKFAFLGAVCGFVGCGLGNIFSATAFYAEANHLGAMEIVSSMNAEFLLNLMKQFSQPMDVLFYAIGIYEGYRFSRKYVLVKKPQQLASSLKT